MNALTEIQAEVLKFVKGYSKKHGMPPTRREISAGFGWKSTNAAQSHLEAIARKGYIQFLDGSVSRGIRILK